MAKKKKRKPRNKIDKKQIDFFEPIDITVFGGEDDPCFGLHFDITTPECSRCGDSELCSIKMMHKMKGVRAKEETKGNFKDNEETFILVEKYLMGCMKKGKSYSIEFITKQLLKKFKMQDDKKAKNLLIKTFKFSGKFKKKEDTLTYG